MKTRKPKEPKKRKGRLKELEHLDIVEVRWLDSTSYSHWTQNERYEEPILCTTVGYLDRFGFNKEYGDFVVLRGSEAEDGTKAMLSSIPLSNVVEFRIISSGRKKNIKRT